MTDAPVFIVGVVCVCV